MRHAGDAPFVNRELNRARTALEPMSRPTIPCAIYGAPWSNANVDIWLFWSRFRSVGSSHFRRIHAYCNPHRNQLEVMVFIEPRIDLMTTRTARRCRPSASRRNGRKSMCRDIDGRQVVMARTVSDARRGPFPEGWRRAERCSRARPRAQDPLVLELASSGADVIEGVDALMAGRCRRRNSGCLGIVPVIAIVTGP